MGTAPSWLSDILEGGLLGMAGLGAYGNAETSSEESTALSDVTNLIGKYAGLTPSTISAGIEGFEQPMSSALNENIMNQVQANLAERGLGNSPEIAQEVTAQALAPYDLQEQSLATQDYFNMLGLPLEAAKSLPNVPQSNVSGIMALLASMGGAGSSLGKTLGSLFGGGGAAGAAPGVASMAADLGLGAATAPADVGALTSSIADPFGTLSGIADTSALTGGTGAATGGGLLSGIEGIPGDIAGGIGSIYGGISSAVSGALGGGELAGILGSVAGVAPFLAPLALLPLFFNGANPNQVGPAQAQQIYESAADDVNRAVKGGYISPEKGQQILQSIISTANTNVGGEVNSLMSSGKGNSEIANTVPGMDQILQSIMNGMPSEGGTTSQPYSASALENLFINPSTPGWYSGSVSQGNQLALQDIGSALA
jgi:hypothetical protein